MPFRHPDIPNNGVFPPAQLGQMYKDALAATEDHRDVWVVGRRSGSAATLRAARFADAAASLLRSREYRYSVLTPRGTFTLSRYMTSLADTSFYSIGGCSDVELVLWTAPEKLGQMGPGVVPALVARVSDPDPFVRERVAEALMSATQDERILARTSGEYLTFYDHPEVPPAALVRAWWGKFGHFWAATDSTR